MRKSRSLGAYAALAVFENPEEQPQPDGDVRDVRDREEEISVVRQTFPDEAEEIA